MSVLDCDVFEGLYWCCVDDFCEGVVGDVGRDGEREEERSK